MKFFNLNKENERNTAIILDDDSIYTYRNLFSLSDKFINASNRNHRSLFFILCKNNIETITAYISVLRSRDVAFLFPHDIDKDEIEKLIRLYEPNYIWEPSSMEKSNSIYNCGSYRLIVNSSIEHKLNDSLRILLPTSGTLGGSKFVQLSEENLISNTKSIVEYLELDKNERALLSMPISYSFGLSILNTHLHVGATTLVTDLSIISKEFSMFIDKYRPTSISGVPYFYSMLQRLRLLEKGFDSLKYLTQAGGKLDDKTIEYFQKITAKNGQDFIVMYGQTEATARISYLPSDHLEKKIGSVGISIPNGLIEIYDDDRLITEPFEIGEIQYTGPNVMIGYAADRDDLSMKKKIAVLKTGDLGYLDSDGFLFITGRKKRIIKMQGSRLSLDDIEGLLDSNNIRSICHGKDDKLLIGIINDRTDPDEIRKIIKSRLNINKLNFNIIKLDQIIYNPNGKIDFQETFQQAEEHDDRYK